MASKRIEIEELLATESYKKGGKIYFHPSELKNRFINRVKSKYPTATISIQVDKEGGAGTEDNQDIITYGRGLIAIDIHDISTSNYCATIGIIWSYDTSKEVIKLYRGVNTFACTNLMISGADDIKVISMNLNVKGEGKDKAWKRKKEDVMEVIDTTLDNYLDTIEQNFKENIKIIEFLQTSIVNKIDIDGFVGKIYIDDVICGSFDYSTLNEACRLLFFKEHPHQNRDMYFIGRDEDLTMMRFYGALTQRLTDDKAGIDWIADKTLEVTDLIFKSLGVDRKTVLEY